MPTYRSESTYEHACAQFVNGVHAYQTVGSQAPHRRGYRPDLPLHSSDAVVARWADTIIQQAAKRASMATSTVVRANSPHPESFRPDIPLGGFSLAQLLRVTKEDRASWPLRPVTVIAPEFARQLWHDRFCYDPAECECHTRRAEGVS